MKIALNLPTDFQNSLESPLNSSPVAAPSFTPLDTTPIPEPKNPPSTVQTPPPKSTTEEPVIPQLNATEILNISKFSPEERERMKRQVMKERDRLNQTIGEEELQKRKEVFQKRKEELVQQKRNVCKEEIVLDLKKHEKQTVAPVEDPTEALRRALSQRVKTIINENK